MQLKTAFYACALLATSSTVQAQINGGTVSSAITLPLMHRTDKLYQPQITSQILSIVESLLENPSVISVATAVAAVDPGFSTQNQATGTPTNILEYATDPAGVLSLDPTSWESALPATLRSQYDALQTAEVLAIGAVVASDNSITQSTFATGASGSTTASATVSAKTGGAGTVADKSVWAAAGVMAGVVGVVAAL